jgi:uncharacterized membrane protein SpoIIM required for sporulation
MMNFCPNCGKPVQSGQAYCGNCGFDLRARAASELSERPAGSPFVRGLGRNSEWFLTPDGFLKVKVTSEYFIFLVALATLPVTVLLGLAIQAPYSLFYLMVWFLLTYAIYDEFKWRRLGRMEGLPFADLSNRKDSVAIPWPFVTRTRLRGRSLSVSAARPNLKASVLIETADAPAVDRMLALKLGDRYTRAPSRRAMPALSNLPVIALALFILSQLILILAASLPFFPGEEQAYATVLNSVRQSVTGASLFEEFRFIFLNNVQVAVAGGFPVFGLLSFVVSDYNTGRVLKEIAIQGNYPVSLEIVSLYLFPHTWVEESSYAIASGAGLYYLFNWNAASIEGISDRLKRPATRFALTFAGVMALLALAGFLEVVEPPLGVAALLIWPVLGVGVFLFRKRLGAMVRRLSTN